MIYIINLFLIFLWNILLRPNSEKGKRQFLTLVYIQLFLIVTFRNYTVGFDSPNYYKLYYQYANLEWNEIFKIKEFGYVAINKLAFIIGGDNYWVLWGLIAILVLSPIIICIYRYSYNVFISILSYICMGYFYNSMNQIRQMIAVSICVLAFIAVDNKKYVKSIIIILLAMSFHSSAIIFLIFPFIRLFIKHSKLWIRVLPLICILGIINFDKIISFIIKYYGVYNIYFEEKKQHLTSGVSAYLFVYLLVLFITFIAVKKDNHIFQKDRSLKLQLGAIIIAEFILCISIRMHIMNRFALFFEIYTCTLLPNMYSTYSKGKYKQLLNLMLITILLFLNHYYLYIAENHLGRAGVIPYLFFNQQ